MSDIEQPAYQQALRELTARQSKEQADVSTAEAEAFAAVERTFARKLRSLEAAHRREWFALRQRFGFPIGAAGKHLLGEHGTCTRPSK